MSEQSAIKTLGKVLDDSLRWKRDHEGQAAYRNTIPCEHCFSMGVATALGLLTGQTAPQVVSEHREKVAAEKRTKSKVVRKKKPPARKVVRKKK